MENFRFEIPEADLREALRTGLLSPSRSSYDEPPLRGIVRSVIAAASPRLEKIIRSNVEVMLDDEDFVQHLRETIASALRDAITARTRSVVNAITTSEIRAVLASLAAEKAAVEAINTA